MSHRPHDRPSNMSMWVSLLNAKIACNIPYNPANISTLSETKIPMEDPHFSGGNYIFKSSKGPFSIAMFLYRDVNNLPKPEARRCWRSSAWDLRHGHLGPRRRKVSSVGDFFLLGKMTLGFQKHLGVGGIWTPNTYHPNTSSGGIRKQQCPMQLLEDTWSQHFVIELAGGYAFVTDVYLFALTKNNSTGRLVDEASFKQARVVVWKLSIFCRLLVQVWSVNVWTTFSIFHKLWNSMPSFLLSRFTATKPSGGNITVRFYKRHLSSLKHLSSVFTNGFMSTVDVHGWIYSRYVSKQIHLLN